MSISAREIEGKIYSAELLLREGNTSIEVQSGISIFRNIVEELFQENVFLRKENQELKNVIKELKGEASSPLIKKNNVSGCKDISSNSELKNAETLGGNGDCNYGYKLDKLCLDKLAERGLPEDILISLRSLERKRFSSKDEFVEAVKEIIGEENVTKYKDRLLRHAVYKKRNRKAKKPDINIDREENCVVDKSLLPDDAQFLKYEEKIVQDIIIRPDNVKFRKEVFYSPSLHKTFSGKIPAGYEGEFGPGVNSQILIMKYVNNMSEPKIFENLRNHNIIISPTYISNYLTKSDSIELFHKEKEELYKAALDIGGYLQIDDTSCRVNGKNKYVQILVNPLFSVYFTTDRKDRLTIIDILNFFKPRSYIFNDETFHLLKKLNVSHRTIDKLKKKTANIKILNEEQIKVLLNELFPLPDKGKITKTRIMEASAIAYYHSQVNIPIVDIFVCDDAPQFKLVTKFIGLCWVHEARHYNKLTPIVNSHKKELEYFKSKFWEFYKKLYNYKKSPSEKSARSLYLQFDDLFTIQTDYQELKKRMLKTKEKKAELLTVLKFPKIPLHNNLSENAARVQKRRQDVSLHTISEAGTKAKDTMLSITETCKKLGINTAEFIYDRVSKNMKMQSLATIIKQKINQK